MKLSSLASAFVVAATLVAATVPGASAQSTPPATAALTEPVIKALQEALIKQGISVKADGILNDQTRAAIRTYQSQHHLPVTGEPDSATFAKLGVRMSATQAPAAEQVASTTSGTSSPAQASAQHTHGSGGGMMMSCPMMQGHAQAPTQGHAPPTQGQAQGPMQGQMHAMMQMMQGMMAMMQTMQGQMHGQQMPMQRGHMGPMHGGGSHQ